MTKPPPSPSLRTNSKPKIGELKLSLTNLDCRQKLDDIGSRLQTERQISARPSLELPPNTTIGTRCTSAPNNLNILERGYFSGFNFNFDPKFHKPRLSAFDSSKYDEIVKNAGYLLINNERHKTDIEDLETLSELGRGTCGQVIKMKHKQTTQQIAVKQMRISGIVEENKRIIMDLDIVLKCSDCENIVKCLGYFITDSEVWICMEMMSMCFDKLLKLTKKPIPEYILGKLTICTINALNYLKEKHNVIHRDVKPSNLLINENGDIKLCDFGISGNLVDSKAKTRSAGCAGYLAPERIEPQDLQNPNYDIRADVWSLGITLVELATGQYPYKKCSSEFDVMSTILKDDAPCLVGDLWTNNFKNFVKRCLIKDVNKRPKYSILLIEPFVLEYKQQKVDVKKWFNEEVLSKTQ